MCMRQLNPPPLAIWPVVHARNAFGGTARGAQLVVTDPTVVLITVILVTLIYCHRYIIDIIIVSVAHPRCHRPPRP